VYYLGCPSGTDADKSQEQKPRNDAGELKSQEQKPRNDAKELKSQEQKPRNDAEKLSSSIQQSAVCSNSAECTTVSTTPASESSEFEDGTGTATEENGLFGAYSDDVATAGILSPSDAELLTESSSSDMPAVAVIDTVNSSVSPLSTCASSTVEETENSSATSPSRHNCSLTQVHPTACDSAKNINSRLSRECSSQSSIRSFFKPVSMSKAQQSDTSVPSLLVKNIREPALSQSCDANSQVQNSSDRNVASSLSLKTNVNNTVTTKSSNFTHKTRKCPFYKWISGELQCSVVNGVVIIVCISYKLCSK